MRFSREHRIEISKSRFLELMFQTEFMRRLNAEALKVQSYESLERKIEAPRWSMKNRITPQDNMPGFIKKLIGGGFYYEEIVTHDVGSDLVIGNMTPNVMKDKLRMGYTIRLVEAGENAVRRIMDWDVEVKVFGLGGQIEKFAGGEIERGMESSAIFMNQYAKTATP